MSTLDLEPRGTVLTQAELIMQTRSMHMDLALPTLARQLSVPAKAERLFSRLGGDLMLKKEFGVVSMLVCNPRAKPTARSPRARYSTTSMHLRAISTKRLSLRLQAASAARAPVSL